MTITEIDGAIISDDDDDGDGDGDGDGDDDGGDDDCFQVSSGVRMKSLGVLDIYGFEVFEVPFLWLVDLNYCFRCSYWVHW